MDPMIETTHWEHESVLDPRATPYYGIGSVSKKYAAAWAYVRVHAVFLLLVSSCLEARKNPLFFLCH
jgi:hypothetical protein